MRLLRPALILLACVVLLFAAFHDVDLSRVIAIAATADLGLLASAVLVDFGIFLIKSLKWRYILSPVRRLPISVCFGAIAVGALANNVLPFRLDELVRTYYLGQKGGVRKATVLGTIVIERLIDATALLTAIVILFCLFRGQDWIARSGGILLVALAGAFGVVATMTARRREIAAFIQRRIPERYQAIRARLLGLHAELTEGLAAFSRTRRISVVSVFALGEWLAALLHASLVLAAFGFDLPVRGALLLVAAGYLSFATPSIPGALGVLELLVKTSLVAAFSIDPHAALSCALVLHALLVVPISILGAFFLLREGLSLGQLRRTGAPAIIKAEPEESDGRR